MYTSIQMSYNKFHIFKIRFLINCALSLLQLPSGQIARIFPSLPWLGEESMCLNSNKWNVESTICNIPTSMLFWPLKFWMYFCLSVSLRNLHKVRDHNIGMSAYFLFPAYMCYVLKGRKKYVYVLS